MNHSINGKMFIVLAFLGVLVGVVAVYFLIGVTEWGHNIPSTTIASDYTVALAWCIAIAFSILLWPVADQDKKVLLILWAARCLVTLGVMLLYEDIYGLDAYTYFTESNGTYYNMENVGFGLGTGNVGLMTWWMNNYLPVFNSYHAIKVIFSLIGLLGLYLFYRGITFYSGKSHPKLLLICGLFPSLVFWSSILGKDPVVMFGICLYSWGMLCWMRSQKSIIYLIGIILGVLLSSWIRPWTGMILLIPSMMVVIFSIRGVFLRGFYLVCISLGINEFFYVFIAHFNLVSVDVLVKKTNILSKAWSFGGSGQIAPDFGSVSDMLFFAPIGMFTALFRPLPGEILNLFGSLAGLENAFLCVLLALSIYRFRFAKLKDPAVVWALSLIFVWSFVYSYVSYQNLGSAFRFRLQVLPVLLVALLYLSKVSTPALREDTERGLQG
jgi:hypothetical protein